MCVRGAPGFVECAAPCVERRAPCGDEVDGFAAVGVLRVRDLCAGDRHKQADGDALRAAEIRKPIRCRAVVRERTGRARDRPLCLAVRQILRRGEVRKPRRRQRQRERDGQQHGGQLLASKLPLQVAQRLRADGRGRHVRLQRVELGAAGRALR